TRATATTSATHVVDARAQRIRLAGAACDRFGAQVRDLVGLGRAVAVAVMARLALVMWLMSLLLMRCMVRRTCRTLRATALRCASTLAARALTLALAAAVGVAALTATLAATTAALTATVSAATT
ncbi:hypothetical protein, partial [Variovorax sp. Varisp62]|uniref:hypothetical protein n=1 Tax=Variovorax sp. Varisp62 TaxID=3243049 RepID=UPI0039B5A2B4